MAPREGRECSAEKLVLAIACGFRVDRGLKRIEDWYARRLRSVASAVMIGRGLPAGGR